MELIISFLSRNILSYANWYCNNYLQCYSRKNNHGEVEKRRQGLRLPDRVRNGQEVQKEQGQGRGKEKQDGDRDGQKIKRREEILRSRLRLREVRQHESVRGLEQAEYGQGEKITQAGIWEPRKNARLPYPMLAISEAYA